MKKTLFITIAVLLFGSSQMRAQITVSVRPCETVELISVLMTLSGAQEYNQPAIWPEYKALVDSCFNEYRDHPAVMMTKELRSGGFGYDLPMSIAVNLYFEDGKLKHPGPVDYGYGREAWSRETTDKYLSAINKFYNDTGFAGFYEQGRPLYDDFCEAFENTYIPSMNIRLVEEFVPTEEPVTYSVCLSYLCGDNNYGANRNGVPNPVMGGWCRNGYMKPTFLRYRVPVVILHEIMHVYCNPLIDKYYSDLEASGDVIWPKIEEKMQQTPYNGWNIVLYESFVRASQIALMHSDEFMLNYVEYEYKQDTAMGFFWIKGLTELLLEYRNDRGLYPTLDSFMPRIVDFFNELAEMI